MDPKEEQERNKRKVPRSHALIKQAIAALSNPVPKLVPRLALVAPNKKNVLQLSLWVEAKIVVKRLDAQGKPVTIPIQDERCLLFLPNGSTLEQKTDERGIVTFRFAPWPLEPSTPVDDMLRPALVLPDILEEWVTPEDSPKHFKNRGDAPGHFGKNKGTRDDYRKGDGVVHFVPIETHEYEIEVKGLTEEQKLQHFRYAYEKNGAKYATASPSVYSESERRYEWGEGAVCNQHVNFFLSYWYNFNKSFENAATEGALTTLTTFDSTRRQLGKGSKYCHCFAELLELVHAPVAGTSVAFKRKLDFKSYDSHYGHNTEYIRISATYLRRTGTPGGYAYSASEAPPPAPAKAKDKAKDKPAPAKADPPAAPASVPGAPAKTKTDPPAAAPAPGAPAKAPGAAPAPGAPANAPVAAPASRAPEWNALVSALGNVNVYSLSDICNYGPPAKKDSGGDQTNNVAQVIKEWAHKHPTNKHITPDEADALANATAKVVTDTDKFNDAKKKYDDAKKAADSAQQAAKGAQQAAAKAQEAAKTGAPAAATAAAAAGKKAKEAEAEHKKKEEEKKQANDEYGKSGQQLIQSRRAVSNSLISKILWELDDGDADDKQLVNALRNTGRIINWDHHAGILLKRGPGGSDPTGVEASKLELWYFPADGTHQSPRPIVMKSMLDRTAPVNHGLTLDGWFVHLSIWKLNTLRPGGFAPQSFLSNKGGLSIDEPPRFVRWAGKSK